MRTIDKVKYGVGVEPFNTMLINSTTTNDA